MTWRVFFLSPYRRGSEPLTAVEKAECAELVSADECFDSQYGALKFMNYVPAPEVKAAEICDAWCKNNEPCVRAKGHTGKHMDSLKPKYVKLKMYAVRVFAPGSWTDVEIVREA